MNWHRPISSHVPRSLRLWRKATALLMDESKKIKAKPHEICSEATGYARKRNERNLMTPVTLALTAITYWPSTGCLSFSIRKIGELLVVNNFQTVGKIMLLHNAVTKCASVYRYWHSDRDTASAVFALLFSARSVHNPTNKTHRIVRKVRWITRDQLSVRRFIQEISLTQGTPET